MLLAQMQKNVQGQTVPSPSFEAGGAKLIFPFLHPIQTMDCYKLYASNGTYCPSHQLAKLANHTKGSTMQRSKHPPVEGCRG